MAEVITMLALSPTMDEGTLVEWLKKEGDKVAEGELIAEIETDKATMEMESFHEGVLLKLLASKGDALPVGAPLAIIGEKGEDVSDLVASLKGGKGGAPAAATPQPAASEPAAPAPAAKTEAAAPQSSDDARVKASPVARKMAAEAGLSLSTVSGSGPAGRIVMKDVEAALSKPSAARNEVAPAATEATNVPLSQMRKTIARRLVEVWTTTPHFYLTAEFDMGRAMAQRKQINSELAAIGSDVKISVNDMIIKACALALQRYPKMNVSFQGDHLVQYADVHVGVAVAVEDGLITPVIRDANRKSLSAIATDVRELAGRAREKRLKPNEYSGGTFSISNLGMFGIDEFSAIINPPEAAILACGAVQDVPVVVDGQLAVGTRMRVTLSCDHRAIDGATGAEFLLELRKLLENPLLLLL
ncbi:MAG: pyruvate dehydrogenase complex dihydrolipoamide acetyltransferase [bacterium]